MAQEAIITSLASQVFDSLVNDEVAVYNENYDQVFRNARPIKVEVKEESKFMTHPAEDGTTFADHRIILPIEIEIQLFLTSRDYQDVYQEIKQIFIDTDPLIISTRSGTFENQFIESLPHVETADVYNGLVMTLKTTQVEVKKPETGIVPANPTYESTTDKGTVQGEDAGQESSTVARILFGGFI